MIKRLLPLAIITAVGVASYLIAANPPQAQRRAPERQAGISVEVQRIVPATYQVVIDSYGKIRPRTQSELLPQVSGAVVWIAPDFRVGGFFEAGEELLRIDDRDYQAALAQAKASLMSARQTLSEEQARSAQAAADWQRLGNGGEIPPLVARQPQLGAARAAVASAEAELAQAQLELDRTRIRAPYAGRILEKSVDIGQVVSSGTVLATLYAIDYVEVRLPLQSRDLAYVDLPENYRFSADPPRMKPQVTFISDLIGHEEWRGQVIQTEGAIDDASRQLYVLAQIDDPYGADSEGRIPLKIGQYVRARIQGREIQDAIVVPNEVIYQGSYVYLVNDGVVERREIQIGWQNEQEALIRAGLRRGDQLVMTSLGQVISGTPVNIRGPQVARDPAELSDTARGPADDSKADAPARAKERLIDDRPGDPVSGGDA